MRVASPAQRLNSGEHSSGFLSRTKDPRLPQAPRGTGDLLAALFGAGLALGGPPPEVLESSVRNLAARLAQGAEDLLDAPGVDADPHGSPPRGGEVAVTLRRP